MKFKHNIPILLMIAAFIIGGCSSPASNDSSKPSSESSSSEPSSESSSSSSSSESSASSSTSSSASSEKGSESSSSSSRSESSSSASSSESSSSASSSESSNSSSSSDSSSSLPPEPTYLEKDVVVEMDPGLKTSENPVPYEITLKYSDTYFLNSAKEYDEDLSMLSFGASIATATKTRGEAFFTDSGFNDITSHDYDKEPTKDTIGYFLAHKSIDDFELVAVSFRGFGYGLEWANNFAIGKTGNHEGFYARGIETFRDLLIYIKQYCSNKDLKIWINGYSRAGALSNVLASILLNPSLSSSPKINQDDLYVYTFEAPASIDEASALAYENVHNINNEVDLITFIPPQTYGLKRCGVDYPIYDADVSTLIKEFDEEIIIPEFVPVEDLTEEPLDSDAKVRDFIINTVFDKKEDEYTDPSVYANTREQYVDNYQEGLSIALGYVFALKEATRASLLADLTALGLGALSIIGDETGVELMNFFKPYLERDGIIYNEEELLSACAILIKGVQNLFLAILLMYVGDQTKGSITRLIDMHYPETTYVLLKNAHQKAQTIE